MAGFELVRGRVLAQSRGCLWTLVGAAAALALLLTGCDGSAGEGGSARPRAETDLREQLMVVLPSAPQIVVSEDEPFLRAERFARTFDPRELLRRAGARTVQADSLAWMIGSAQGRAFLKAPEPRAIARGEPAARCPATGLAHAGEPGAEGGHAETVRRALDRCLAALPDRPETEGCGCKLLALDSVLTVPQSEMAYATGVTARVKAPDLGIDAILIAEDDPEEGTLLRDLRGPVARLLRDGDRATLTLLDGGARLEGRREAVGFRRGRLAERLYLEDAQGRRAVLLIGFSPKELAERAGAGLAWPEGG